MGHSVVRCGLVPVFLAGLFFARGCATARADDPFRVVSDPGDPFSFFVTQGSAPAMRIGMAGWGPNWGWVSVEGKRQGNGDPLVVTGTIKFNEAEKQQVELTMRARGGGPGAPRSVVLEYEMKTDKDVPLTMLAPTIGAAEGVSDISAQFTHDGNKQDTAKIPSGPSGFDNVSAIAFSRAGWPGAITVAIAPAVSIHLDGNVRVKAAADVLKAGVTKTSITLTFPTDVALLTKASDLEKMAPVIPTADWFAYRPQWDLVRKSVIDMSDWLDRPAGKHGAVKMVNDHFEFADGTAVKFWGTNLSYAQSAPAKADADFAAVRFAKYGINAVRMHKFTGFGWEGIGDENDSTRFTTDGLDKLDYFAAALTKNGVYYGWSHTYHFKVRKNNRARISGFDELMKKGGDTYGVINWAEDVQDLMIEQVVNLLKHKNPYTGKTYAQDPALNFVELQNEDDIFFYTSIDALKDFPTYRQQLQNRYAAWLKEKYGSQEKLAAAWGGALRGEESIAGNSVTVQSNPWFMSDESVPKLQGGERQRMLDNAAFLFETQRRFYDKYVKAIRAAGYTGPLVGSPWQAPAGLPHYYNLLADYEVGYIDRHDYFGGTLADTMLKVPGSGYLSAGLQQVVDRPFGLSEWITVYPSLYSAEGPVILAAYGMGLQGWDASYEFQSVTGKPGDIVGNQPWGVWNADVPTQIGQNPVLSRMILRGDVKEGPVISVRRVSRAGLATASLDFKDNVAQQGDIKTFGAGGGTVPMESLAAGRAVVEFTEKPAASTFPELSKYKKGSVITSATGQLAWDGGVGVIAIDTAGTQGVVGFVGGKTCKLGNVSIACTTPYASILLTAQEKTGTLATTKHVLISALGRNSNAGFRVSTLDGKTIIDNGKAPIMLEPLAGQISFPGRRIAQVLLLDHDGKVSARPARPLNAQHDTMTIDGVKDQVIYYEVVLE